MNEPIADFQIHDRRPIDMVAIEKSSVKIDLRKTIISTLKYELSTIHDTVSWFNFNLPFQKKRYEFFKATVASVITLEIDRDIVYIDKFTLSPI